MGDCYAHTGQKADQSDWEPLELHLKRVAALAGEFANAFSASEWGWLAGEWHDLGKYSTAFQVYLCREMGIEAHEASLEDAGQRPRHAIAGARHAKGAGRSGIILAYGIAGHHGGLNDTVNLETRLDSEPVHGMPDRLPKWLQQPLPFGPPLRMADGLDLRSFTFATFVRFLFSCLVDADFLATEAFMNPQTAALRIQPSADLAALRNAISGFIGAKQAKAARQAKADAGSVNGYRSQVLRQCLSAAEKEPGFFSLTVPTGGGKTLSSLSLGLEHALRHGLRRVIYAIPFTSIIEQNADVFRQALGSLTGALLEHHSNLDPRKETQASRLMAENWNAPLVVTTNVQFFESLFSNRPSDCRKLHRIARSVIILDEAQSIPVSLLKPCLAILRELVSNYGCSVILCTATQPAIENREDFPIGLSGVREVVPDTRALYAAMRRVDTQYIGAVSDEELSAKLSQCKQALCIVNTRAHAAAVYSRLSDQAHVLHLSALMCPAHRSRVIRLIRWRLQAERPCVVISTQLVEAGVDLDFPVVYRAMAGLDSIAQAAGRCNREGRKPTGQVYVFEPECAIPPGDLRHAADSARDVISRFTDLLSLEAIDDYFRLHYWKESHAWDKYQVMDCFAQAGQMLNFATGAERFKMIQQVGRPVIVPYGRRGKQLAELLKTSQPDELPPSVYRQAQRLTVQIPVHHWQRLTEGGAVALYGPGESLPLLMNSGLYDRKLGLRLDGAATMEVESLIV
ncbi:MAG: CRISPR-associated helicase Cas3' [Planctomycetota bacterium]|nr:CRISPR-associated helicase Cas3' [Planctomycetota bacterium]